MLWDKYLKLLRKSDAQDRHVATAIKEASSTALFDFGNVGLHKRKDVQLESPDDFFLPFPEVAVQTRMEFETGEPCECVVITSDPKQDDEWRKLHGEQWPVNVLLHTGQHPDRIALLKGTVEIYSAEDGEMMARARLYSACQYEYRTGRCVQQWTDDPTYSAGNSYEMSDDEFHSMTTIMGSEFLRACYLLEKANSPANWVVQVVDEHARIQKARKKKNAPPLRERYIVVPDRDLDRVLRIPNEGGDTIERRGHRRRAHYRRLTSPRYRLKRGQRVLVRESWIGPQEAVHEGCRYTVLTSLPGRSS